MGFGGVWGVVSQARGGSAMWARSGPDMFLGGSCRTVGLQDLAAAYLQHEVKRDSVRFSHA